MALQDQIEAKAKEIHTDGYAMSIGEVLSLYRDGDIEIHPEFQRIFRWTDEQKSRLVESILLGIPIPPICQHDYRGPDAELREEFGEYVTGWVRKAAEVYGSPESTIEIELFKRTFALLNRALGENAFRRWDGHRHLGPFSIASFEFITSGITENLTRWEARPPNELVERVRDMWSALEFKANTGAGMSPRRRVPKLVRRARTYFAD